MLQFLVDYGYIIFTALLLPAFAFAIYAQTRVTRTYSTFKQIESSEGKTAHEVAEQILTDAGITDHKIQQISGDLTDNFNPKTKTISLSESVYNSKSVAAIGVAAHEVGHAIQHHTKYFPIRLRTLTIGLCNLTSQLLLPLLIIGILLNSWTLGYGGIIVILVAVSSYVLSFLLSLVTLPVEFNASKRAVKILQTNGILTPTETAQAKRVLDAAALTYVAASLMSLLQFLRILFYILGSGKKRK